jgi:hypothetical protein
LGASGVHFFPNDLGDFLQDAPHQGEISIDSATDATDIAGANQEFMAGDFGFGWVFPEGDE